MAVFDKVKLAANNRFYGIVVLACLCHKLEGSKHIAVVGDSHAAHTFGGGFFVHIGYACRPVEQRKLGVTVKVVKCGHVYALSVWFR
jgi:hypothetical protein